MPIVVVATGLLFLTTAAPCSELIDIQVFEKNEDTERPTKAMRHGDANVHWAAAVALATSDVPLEQLIDQSLKGSDEAREELARRKDPRALAPLIKALGNWNPSVREAAAGILVKIGDKRVIDRLITALGDRSSNVRGGAALTLGKLGDKQAVDPLITALVGDGYLSVRKAAAAGLGGLSEPLGRLIFGALQGSQETADELMIMMRKDPRAFGPLVKALDNSDPSVRQAAAGILGKLDDERAVEPLITVLGYRSSNVREAAARSLKELGDKRAVEPLIKALGDGYSSVREAAAWSLKELGDKRAVEPLIKALGDGDPRVREAAAWGLARIGDKRAVTALIELLDDRISNVREADVSAEPMTQQEWIDKYAVEGSAERVAVAGELTNDSPSDA